MDTLYTSEAACTAGPDAVETALSRWLDECGLVETKRAAIEPRDQLFDEIAVAAVTCESTAKLLRTVKYQFDSPSGRGGITINLGGCADTAVPMGVAAKLQAIGFVTSATLVGNTLKVRLNERDTAQRRRLTSFLTGSWLEAGARGVACSAVGATGGLISNLELTDDGGRHYELDLVVVADDSVTVVECKAGRNPEEDLPRFRDVCDKVGVSGTHAVFVASQIEESSVDIASKFYDLTVIRPGDLAAHMATLFTPAAC